jgi:hypothetical protein
MSNSTFDSRNQIVENVLRVIFCFGIVTNVICIIIFLIIIVQKKNRKNFDFIFKYLLIKSINDLALLSIDLIESIFYPITIQEDSSVHVDKFYLIWKSYFIYFINSILMTSSGLLDILVTLNVYLFITKKIKWLRNRKYFYLQISLIYLISIILCSLYIIMKNNFDQFEELNPGHTMSNILKLIRNLLRDLITGILLIVINLLIYKFIHKPTHRKIGIQFISHKEYMSRVSKQIRQTEMKKVKMCLFICINYIVCHLPIFVSTLRVLFIEKVENWFSWIAVIIFMLSFITPFFIYCFLDNTFANVICKKIETN